MYYGMYETTKKQFNKCDETSEQAIRMAICLVRRGYKLDKYDWTGSGMAYHNWQQIDCHEEFWWARLIIIKIVEQQQNDNNDETTTNNDKNQTIIFLHNS